MSYQDVFATAFPYIVGIGVILSILAKVYISRVSTHALGQREKLGWYGEKAVRQMLDYYKIHDVTIQEQDGIFNDRYIPGTKTMLLCRVSSQSPSLLGLATALHQAGIAVQNHRAKIMMAGKAIALFFSRMAALLATIAIPFMLFFPIVLYIGLIIFTIVLGWGILCIHFEQDACQYANIYIQHSKQLTGSQIKEIRRIFRAQALSCLATTFIPLNIIGSLLVGNKRFYAAGTEPKTDH